MSGDVDRAVIADLDKDGLLHGDTLVHLEEALRWSFTVGVALGIIMATRNVDEITSFKLLRAATQRTNRSLRALADDIRLTRDLNVLSA